MNQQREVRFDIFCPACKYKAVEQTKEPCASCLEEPCQYDSMKPVRFEGELPDLNEPITSSIRKE